MVKLNNPLNQIFQSYHENHLSHAFLIETNDQERCLQDLKQELMRINCPDVYQEKCSKCNICHLIEIDQLPSFVLIRPNGITIKKEQILELKQKFSTKPIYSKYNMYVVMNSEKFNSSSANTLLKFIEEPEEGIIGFFLTNNKENIIDTIRSRCQIISNFYNQTCGFDDNIMNKSIDYLRTIHVSHDLSLLDNRNFLNDYSLEKEDYQLFFQSMIHIYYVFYKCSLHLEELDEKFQSLSFLLKENSSYFLKQLKLVEELEKELGYNVNINLLMDRFLLETRS